MLLLHNLKQVVYVLYVQINSNVFDTSQKKLLFERGQ